MTLSRSKSARQRSNRFGRRAEFLSTMWLRLRGYSILERGFRVSGGEIDIVARRGSTVAFIEVKARPTLDEALLAVTPMKQRSLRRAVSVWLGRNEWAMTHTLRGDVMLVAPRRWLRHVEDAYVLNVG